MMPILGVGNGSTEAGNRHASYWAVAVLKRIIPKLIETFPKAEIIIRGDAGFAVTALYEYCEQENLKYVIGLIRNDVLERMIEDLLNKAHEQYQQPARSKGCLPRVSTGHRAGRLNAG